MSRCKQPIGECEEGDVAFPVVQAEVVVSSVHGAVGHRRGFRKYSEGKISRTWGLTGVGMTVAEPCGDWLVKGLCHWSHLHSRQMEFVPQGGRCAQAGPWWVGGLRYYPIG